MEQSQKQTLSDSEKELRVLKISLILYVIVFGLKLGAYFITGVMALLAEGLHTLSDIFVSSFLYIAAIWSQKKADKMYTYGYGRAQYIGALVAATLFISFTAFELYKESIPRLFSDEKTTFSNLPVAFAVLGISILIALAPMISLMKQKKKGAAAKAQFLELINDQLGLLAALIGTIFVQVGFPIADPIASILVATIITVNGVKLFHENLSLLLGRSPEASFMTKVEETVRSAEGVVDVHGIKCEYIGPESIHVDMHIEVKRGTPIEEANRIAHDVEKKLDALTDGPDIISIHVDPENPEMDNI